MSAVEFTFIESLTPDNQEKTKVIIRVATSFYRTYRGIATKKEIIFLRRLCKGYIHLEEDAMQMDAEQAILMIRNLDACVDGVYEVCFCGGGTDYWGEQNDYWYELYPYKKEVK